MASRIIFTFFDFDLNIFNFDILFSYTNIKQDKPQKQTFIKRIYIYTLHKFRYSDKQTTKLFFPLQPPVNRFDRKLTIDSFSPQGYDAHLLSTFGEWALAASFLFYYITFIRDFQRFTITVSPILYVAHLDDSPRRPSDSPPSPRVMVSPESHPGPSERTHLLA